MAYGARLESVLGASPRGFESPILRDTSPGSVEIPGFLLQTLGFHGSSSLLMWTRKDKNGQLYLDILGTV